MGSLSRDYPIVWDLYRETKSGSNSHSFYVCNLVSKTEGEAVEVGEYLTRLCESLAASMIGERRSITLHVTSDPGAVVSEQAVSPGLIVTELAINALKHAFPVSAETGKIEVEYKVTGSDWILSVSDNGCGISGNKEKKPAGLGTSIVKALAQQLEADVVVTSSDRGTRVAVEHRISAPKLE